eukprot:14613671-Alexandrium_andersonii.AAC.1
MARRATANGAPLSCWMSNPEARRAASACPRLVIGSSCLAEQESETPVHPDPELSRDRGIELSWRRYRRYQRYRAVSAA